MPVVTIDQLTFTYPEAEKPALRDLSFAADPGELVAVIGANNSGKSTLCYALTGVVPLFYHGRMAGSVVVGDVNTATSTIGALAQTVGLVMQVPSSQLSGVRYTVFEEVAFGLENRGVSRPEMDRRVTEVLACTGLSDVRDRSPYQLSGGQQQKLAIASILVTSPSVLVLDEPTTFLDPQGALQVFSMLLELKRQGKTVIVAEQRLEWIAEYADRVIALADGELVMSGTAEEVLTHSKMKDIRLGWMPFTQAAKQAKQQGLWPQDRPLPATFMAAVAGFQKSP